MFGCFFGHDVKVERKSTREFYGSCSPKEGTEVTKDYYFCIRCGQDLTQKYEMRVFYKAEQEAFNNWCKAQAMEARSWGRKK